MVFVAGVVFLAKGRTLRAFFLLVLVLGIWALERAQFDTSPFSSVDGICFGCSNRNAALFWGSSCAVCISYQHK